MNIVASGKSFVQAIQLLFRPYETQVRLHKEQGELIFASAIQEELVFAATPEGAKEVFAANPISSYRPYGASILGPFLGRRSVFMLTGMQHRKERSIIMPAFARGRMSAYNDVILEAVREQTQKWAADGKIVLMEENLEATLTIILKAVFGVHEAARMDRYRHIIAEAVDSVKPSVMFFSFLQHDFGGIGPWAAFHRKKAILDEIFYEELALKRASGEYGDDVLSLLIQARYEDGTPLPDEVIRDHLASLLVAGHETTSIALSNALYRLHRNPTCLRRLREELDDAVARADGELSADEIVKLPYLDGVVNETLRLAPIVTGVIRELRRPMTVRGQELPVGTKLGVAIGAIHHDPTLYPNPLSFKPERFIERKYRPHEYMPFGGGHRRCVGATLALHEMKLVLAELITSWEFDLMEPTPLRFIRRNVVMAPETGVRMRIIGRRLAN